MNTFTFPVEQLRTTKDPNLEAVKRTTFYLRVRDVPIGLPIDVNPRSQKPGQKDGKVYCQVRDSLLGLSDKDTVGLFHLRNQGITILAKEIEYNENTHTCTLGFDPDDLKNSGVANGGHTYDIFCYVINMCLEEGIEIPNEVVKVEVLTGVDKDKIPEIARGLNSSVQVSAQAINNLEGKYEWIKEVLFAYKDQISWEQNDTDISRLSVRDILGYMVCLDFIEYSDEKSSPTIAYTGKGTVENKYITNLDKYMKMNKVLLDICILHDHIALGAHKIWNSGRGGRFPSTKLSKKRLKKSKTIFCDKDYKDEVLLQEPIVLPILSGFRIYLEIGPDGFLRWKIPFNKVLEAWTEVGYSLLEKAYKLSESQSTTLNSIGRDSAFWEYAYLKLKLEMYEISEKQAVVAQPVRYATVER